MVGFVFITFAILKAMSTITISDYNASQKGSAKEICIFLEDAINKNAPKTTRSTVVTSKIWHRTPVWFINDNPIVAYSVRKDAKNGSRVSLMFFSGQSFDEADLQPEGKFKAAEIFYTDVKEIKVTHLKRWLKKARDIQWDYKNIVKRKGLLEKVK